MLNRINIFDIIRDHLKTLARLDIKGDRISFQDLTLFFLFPMVVASILIYYYVGLKEHITDLITSISILGGFLFNLLAIVYGLMDKLQADAKQLTDGKHSLKATFVKEIHTNISFNIILSLMLLFLLLAYSYINSYSGCLVGIYKFCYFKGLYIVQSLTWIIYSLLGTFSLTMLMILNRIYILLKKD